MIWTHRENQREKLTIGFTKWYPRDGKRRRGGQVRQWERRLRKEILRLWEFRELWKMPRLRRKLAMSMSRNKKRNCGT